MPQIVNHIEVQTGTIYIDRPGYYFGYGLESVPEVMEAIIGQSLVVELGVTAVGKQLVVQELDQVPEKPSEELGGLSTQQILAQAWGKHTDTPFSSYALRSSDNRGDVVRGNLYKLGMDDALVLVDWDLANPNLRDAAWRHLDHGIELADGRQVMTFNIDPSQAVDRTVNGTDYDPFLNDRATTFKVIQDFVAERQENS